MVDISTQQHTYRNDPIVVGNRARTASHSHTHKQTHMCTHVHTHATTTTRPRRTPANRSAAAHKAPPPDWLVARTHAPPPVCECVCVRAPAGNFVFTCVNACMCACGFMRTVWRTQNVFCIHTLLIPVTTATEIALVCILLGVRVCV